MKLLPGQTPAGPATRPTMLAIVIGTALLALLSTATADAFVYWSGPDNSISRVNLDGTGLERGFVTPPKDSPWGIGGIGGIAVDNSYIYYTAPAAIGRARLDGSHLDPHFITNIDSPVDIAVDRDHIYWITGGGLGRADIDGTHVDEAFIKGNGYDVAIDNAHIYWTNDGYDLTHISRADLDGTDVEPDFIDVPGGVLTHVAVDDSHIYWTDRNDLTEEHDQSPAISRARLDGTSIEPHFIDGLNSPGNLAVDAHHIYWQALGGSGYGISRADLDGGAVETDFVPGAFAGAIAVDGLASPPPPPPVPPDTRIDDFYVLRHKHRAAGRAGFTFSSTQPDWTFRCSIDRGAFKACIPPQTYRKLKAGRHIFEVVAVSRQGAVDPTPARRHFRV